MSGDLAYTGRHLLTEAQRQQLLANGRRQRAVQGTDGELDFVPVVKLFGGPATYLLTELDDDGDTAFGLCDLSMGYPELGSVSLGELQDLRIPVRIGSQVGQVRMERDAHWQATAPLAVYAEAARAARQILDRVTWNGPPPVRGTLP